MCNVATEPRRLPARTRSTDSAFTGEFANDPSGCGPISRLLRASPVGAAYPCAQTSYRPNMPKLTVHNRHPQPSPRAPRSAMPCLMAARRCGMMSVTKMIEHGCSRGTRTFAKQPLCAEDRRWFTGTTAMRPIARPVAIGIIPWWFRPRRIPLHMAAQPTHSPIRPTPRTGDPKTLVNAH